MENRRSTDDKMSRRVWGEMKNRKTNKARMAEARRKSKTREEKERRL